MRALAIDFAPGRRTPPVAGLVLLAAAVAFAAGFGWHYRGLLLEIERIEARLDSGDAPRFPGRAAAAPVPARLVPEIARARHVVRRLTVPWNELFSAVEMALDENVALLSIQPDPATARVSVIAEARNANEALWFARRLSTGGVLDDAFLTGHELLRREGTHRPVRFTLSARWLAAETTAEGVTKGLP